MKRRPPALFFVAIDKDKIARANGWEHGGLSFSDAKKNGAREPANVRAQEGAPGFRLVFDRERLAGSHSASEQRHLDKRRVREVRGRWGRGRLDQVANGETEGFHEALRVAPMKANLSRQQAAHFGLRAMQPGGEGGLSHAVGSKPQQPWFQVGEFHARSICQFGIGSNRNFAKLEWRHYGLCHLRID